MAIAAQGTRARPVPARRRRHFAPRARRWYSLPRESPLPLDPLAGALRARVARAERIGPRSARAARRRRGGVARLRGEHCAAQCRRRRTGDARSRVDRARRRRVGSPRRRCARASGHCARLHARGFACAPVVFPSRSRRRGCAASTWSRATRCCEAAPSQYAAPKRSASASRSRPTCIWRRSGTSWRTRSRGMRPISRRRS